MKISLKGLNNKLRLSRRKNQQLKDRLIEFIQSKDKNKEKKMNRVSETNKIPSNILTYTN